MFELKHSAGFLIFRLVWQIPPWGLMLMKRICTHQVIKKRHCAVLLFFCVSAGHFWLWRSSRSNVVKYTFEWNNCRPNYHLRHIYFKLRKKKIFNCVLNTAKRYFIFERISWMFRENLIWILLWCLCTLKLEREFKVHFKENLFSTL